MVEKWMSYLSQYVVFQKLFYFLDNIRLYYFDVSLLDLIKIFLDKLSHYDLFERANNVAFSFVLAIFPTIIFFFTLIPYVHTQVPEISVVSMMDFMSSILPNSIYDTAAPTIFEIVSKRQGELLSFGFLFAYYLSTNGTISLMNAFNRLYKTDDKRGFIKRRLIATWLTLMLALVIIVGVVLLVLGQRFVNIVAEWSSTEEYIYYLILALRFFVISVIFQLGISLLYYFGPQVKDRWHFLSIGSVIATSLAILASYGFATYINNFGTYNKIYGSIGVLIAFMIWCQLIALILILGFEINATIDHARIIAEEKEEQGKKASTAINS